MNSNIYSQIANFCHQNLLNNKEVLSYLHCRGISKKSIKYFELGYFPHDLRDLFKSGIDPILLRKLGIIYNASSSRFKWNNLIFPIKNVYGEYIAFAGRTLGDYDEVPKYVNTIYNKSHHLFALNFAKSHIISNNCVYVVEGYFDVITPFQHGLKNIVAVCGKYLSIRHIALLARYTDNIVLMFDNEEEAQVRAQKIVELRQFDNINLTIKNPLNGCNYKDIDDFLRDKDMGELNMRMYA